LLSLHVLSASHDVCMPQLPLVSACIHSMASRNGACVSLARLCMRVLTRQTAYMSASSRVEVSTMQTQRNKCCPQIFKGPPLPYICYAGTPPLPPGAAAAAMAGGGKQAAGQGSSSSRPCSASDPLGLNPVLAAALQLHDTRPPTPLGVADYAAMFRAATPEVRWRVDCWAAVMCCYSDVDYD
jgi:hypothetical protein